MSCQIKVSELDKVVGVPMEDIRKCSGACALAGAAWYVSDMAFAAISAYVMYRAGLGVLWALPAAAVAPVVSWLLLGAFMRRGKAALCWFVRRNGGRCVSEARMCIDTEMLCLALSHMGYSGGDFMQFMEEKCREDMTNMKVFGNMLLSLGQGDSDMAWRFAEVGRDCVFLGFCV